MNGHERYHCVHDGCERGYATGHALHRVSPKGELFKGKCGEHFEGEVDPLVQAIEDRNLGLRQ
jgi:hypothetical protein